MADYQPSWSRTIYAFYVRPSLTSLQMQTYLGGKLSVTCYTGYPLPNKDHIFQTFKTFQEWPWDICIEFQEIHW